MPSSRRARSIDAFLRDIETDSPLRYWEFLKRAMGHDHTLKSIANGLSLKTNEYLESLPLPRLWDYGTRTQLGYAEHLIERNPEPFFGFINLMETHLPFANNIFFGADGVPNSWNSGQFRNVELANKLRTGEVSPDDDHIQHYRALYAASIEYVDRQLVAFIESIQAMTDEETTVVVTADHGEDIAHPGDQQAMGHIGNLAESLLHVPLELDQRPRRDA
ncbi:MAG: sulfatase-like hydrolase/transferase [Natrialbaceae archaeon]|nr:sulfatase-like hydrolase/transferase [Natrialbaceae archaeon]